MKNNRQMKKGLKKRIISFILSSAMILEMLPVAELPDFPINLNSLTWSEPAVVSAADDVTDDDDPDFPHNADNSILVPFDRFVSYSEHAQKYHKYHQNDKIKLQTATGDITYFEAGFKGLGTSTYPFAGSIEIENNSNATLNLDAPLFNYVYDTVQVNGGQYFNISRYYDLSRTDIEHNTPLIARHVWHNGDGGAMWNINITKPSQEEDNPTLASFGGVLGAVGDADHSNVSLTLNVKLNQVEGDAGAIALSGSEELGFACGSIVNNSTLGFSLVVDEGETARSISNIETSSGDVGGLVGNVDGGTFTYTGKGIQTTGSSIKTDNGYAGGLIGVNKGTVTIYASEKYEIKQNIEGTNGAGGIYGYYAPSSAETIQADTYGIDCQVNGAGYDGGLFGVIESDYAITVVPGADVTIKSNHASGSAEAYGGFAGKMTADTFVVEATRNNNNPPAITARVKVETSNGGTATYYGGGIGEIADTVTTPNPEDPDHPTTTVKNTYAKIDGLQVKSSNAGSLTYGGVIAKADRTFADVKDISVEVAGFKGGGVIGSLKYGVLKMSGTTDLSKAQCTEPASGEEFQVGQIVGFRDDALIFTDGSIKRYGATNDNDPGSEEVDDIGAWGEVLRFSTPSAESEGVTTTTEKIGSNSVLSINESTHQITIESPVLSITSEADFCKTALCFQIDTTQNGFLQFSSGNTYNSANITGESIEIRSSVSSGIDLSNTGLTGLTRDNDISSDSNGSKCTFSGTFNGNNKTITLATGTPNASPYQH